jgi:hypothetical protein
MEAYLSSITQVTAERHAIFVLRVPVGYFATSDFAKYFDAVWNHAWKEARRTTAPPVIVIGDDMELTAINDAELKNAGLMRIENRETISIDLAPP